MGQAFGLFLAALLVLIAVVTIRSQFKLFEELRAAPSMPEVDRNYLRKRGKRRVLNSILLFVLGGMLAYTYLSGNEARAEEIGDRLTAARLAAQENPNDADLKAQAVPTEEEKEFRLFWASYWIVFLLILFVVFTLAIMDFWATRRYAVKEMKRIREDQKMLLERDLAVYRQSKRDRMVRKDRP